MVLFSEQMTTQAKRGARPFVSQLIAYTGNSNKPRGKCMKKRLEHSYYQPKGKHKCRDKLLLMSSTKVMCSGLPRGSETAKARHHGGV